MEYPNNSQLITNFEFDYLWEFPQPLYNLLSNDSKSHFIFLFLLWEEQSVTNYQFFPPGQFVPK